MRSAPDISLLPSLAFSSAPSIAASAGATSATKVSPAAVNATLRVVRLKRRTWRRSSKAAIEWLSAEGETPSSRASKVATAIAAGSAIVVKPSEMSAIQTQVMAQAIHAAGLPKGVINIVNGYGPVVGAALSTHPDVAKISFTGSTVTGRAILTAAAETFKRVTLELGGEGPQILLEDADLTTAIPIALASGFANSGQACVAGTRLLVPECRLDEALVRLKDHIETLKVGAATDPEAQIGPMVSQKQRQRVQSY